MNREKGIDIAIFLLRFVTGLLLMHIGALKLQLMFPNLINTAKEVTMVTKVAGYLEFGGGLAILFGLLTRPVAFLLCGQMAVIYFWKHFTPDKFWPIENKGEKAVLFCFIFLFFWAYGAGKWSLDRWILKKR